MASVMITGRGDFRLFFVTQEVVIFIVLGVIVSVAV